MHDIDRTQLEYDQEYYEFDSGQFEYGDEAEFDQEFDQEFDREFDQEFDYESPFEEAEEMELAAELLTVSNEAELDQFIGKLIGRAARGFRKFAQSPTGRWLGRGLRNVAKKGLPMLGRVAGGFFGGPIGAQIGGSLASQAGRLFGLELEGLSPEDQEFNLAREFVRFGGEAARRASRSGGRNPKRAAMGALRGAAGRFAPGLSGLMRGKGQRRPGRSAGGRPSLPGGRQSLAGGFRRPQQMGRWVRRGNTIILVGCFSPSQAATAGGGSGGASNGGPTPAPSSTPSSMPSGDEPKPSGGQEPEPRDNQGDEEFWFN
jgi:hypothetical protein